MLPATTAAGNMLTSSINTLQLSFVLLPG